VTLNRYAAKVDANQPAIVEALGTIVLTMPWPPSALSPNKRLHWAQLAKAKAAYRHACAMTARSQGAGKIDAEALTVRLRFVPPDRRPRDVDNCIAAMKSGLDGLADVLGVNDRNWTLQIDPMAQEIGGFVRVWVMT